MIPTLHCIPEWVKTHPELSKGKGHFLPFAIELPVTRRLVEAYYKTFLTHLGGLKNLVTLCLLNEPEYEAGSDEALAMYRAWLKKRYKTIEQLNRRWKTDYPSFAAIPITKNVASTGALYDWLVFNRTLVTDFVADVCKLAKKYDPLQRPVHVKCMAGLWRNANESYGGIDREAIGGLTDIVGFDGGLTALHLDFIGSLNPGKPVFHSEGGYTIPAMWETMIHGLDGLTLWLWDPPWGGWGRMPNYPLQQPEQLHAKGRTTLDLQRLAPQIQAIAHVPHEVAMVYSFASQALDYKNHFETIRQAHETLQWCGMPVGFVSENQLRKGEVSGLKTIIVPDARFVLDTTVTALKAFVKAGGRVILIGDESLAKTPYSDANDIKVFRKSPKVIVLKKDSANWTDAKRSLKWFAPQLTKSGIDRPIRACDAQGRLIPGVELQTARFKGKQIVYLCSSRENAEPIAVQLRAGEKTLSGKDLISNSTVKSPILLKPKQPMLIEVH